MSGRVDAQWQWPEDELHRIGQQVTELIAAADVELAIAEIQAALARS